MSFFYFRKGVINRPVAFPFKPPEIFGPDSTSAHNGRGLKSTGAPREDTANVSDFDIVRSRATMRNGVLDELRGRAMHEGV